MLATDSAVSEGTVVSTFHQFAGRGQLGNVWECPPDKNIAMSTILRPKFLAPQRQFLLNCITALAVRDTLAKYCSKEVSVKWPNDVLIGEKKACGILIQNSLSRLQILTSVVGIGLNINQNKFPTHLPYATSLALETGKTHDLVAIQQQCLSYLERYYLSLRQGNFKRIETAYKAQLYAYRVPRKYQLADGTIFEATITGINPSGQLILNWDGQEKAFNIKEVALVR